LINKLFHGVLNKSKKMIHFKELKVKGCLKLINSQKILLYCLENKIVYHPKDRKQ
jgi:hypothetical protein